MKKSSFFKLMSLWPPYLGAGIRVKNINNDLTSIDVEMKLRFWNQNYVHTQFGGSLYSMTDPFLMLMLKENLGKNYIVWDKSACIDFKQPGKGKVYAQFRLPQEKIIQIKEQADSNYKCEPEFDLNITNDSEEVIATVHKKLYIRNKSHKYRDFHP